MKRTTRCLEACSLTNRYLLVFVLLFISVINNVAHGQEKNESEKRSNGHVMQNSDVQTTGLIKELQGKRKELMATSQKGLTESEVMWAGLVDGSISTLQASLFGYAALQQLSIQVLDPTDRKLVRVQCESMSDSSHIYAEQAFGTAIRASSNLTGSRYEKKVDDIVETIHNELVYLHKPHCAGDDVAR
jgi:hypothetical protein